MIILTWLMVAIVSAEVEIPDKVVSVTTEKSNTEKNEARERYKREGLENEYEEDVIQTEYGPVRRFQKESGIWQYFDIPYGKFNINNPFQEPLPPEQWTEVREKSEHTSRCPQIDSNSDNYSGTIDCLTLSIFTPNETKDNDILFHIHDGSFSSGSGDNYIYGPDFLVPQGIILVLPNYRIGPLGFLCLQNDDIPGNAGLKDLVQALNWTKNNIEAFGGNSSNVVVSGSGSGAALVEYLVTSEKSKDLISKAITESGFMLSNWAIDREPLDTAAILEENLKENYSATTLTTFTYELTETSLEELVKASKGITFKPCIETNVNGFLTNSPMSVLSSAKLNIKYMIGAANYAGMHEASQYTEEGISQLNEDYELLLPNDLEFEGDSKYEIAKQIKNQYFEDHEITSQNIRKLSLCYTDHTYLSPAIRGARLLVDAGATIYFYEFMFGGEEENVASRGESMKYVFSRENTIIDNTKEYKMENLMTDLWANFIKTGIPKSDGIDWQKFEETKDELEKFLSVGSTVKLQEGLHLDRLRLWDEIYKSHYIDRNKTMAPESPLEWDGIFEATHRVKCPQPDGTGDENCLVINVFAPEHIASSPVLVYFHGGGFQKGWGYFNAPVRFLNQNIIFVSFNYRLGALGFLNLGTPDISGNAGLKDQVAALYWVQKNIAKFGGNPLETTVYGTGSGAASIELLIISDIARDLFQRAILDSGSALSPSSKSHDTQVVAISFAHQLGFDGDADVYSLEEFYYKVPTPYLTNVSRIFLPCIEQGSNHSLIDRDPWYTIQKGQFHHVSIIFAYTMAEEVAMVAEDINTYNIAPEDFNNLIPNNLEINSTSDRKMIAKFIKDFYFGVIEKPNSATQSYIDYINDVFLKFPTVKSLVQHAYSSSKPIFLMDFSYVGSLRAGHGDIFKYLSAENFEGNEERVAGILTTLWSNFIKLGDPTPLTTSLITTIWQPVIPRTIDEKPVLRGVQCLKFGQTIFNTELHSPQLTFWDRIYSKYYKF